MSLDEAWSKIQFMRVTDGQFHKFLYCYWVLQRNRSSEEDLFVVFQYFVTVGRNPDVKRTEELTLWEGQHLMCTSRRETDSQATQGFP